MMEGIHYEVVEAATSGSRSDEQAYSAMDGEWLWVWMGIQEPQSRVAVLRPYKA